MYRYGTVSRVSSSAYPYEILTETCARMSGCLAPYKIHCRSRTGHLNILIGSHDKVILIDQIVD